jgi:hypothetical protein
MRLTMPAADPLSDRRVDHSALRTNQAFIITLLLAAFILDVWPLAAFVAAVMLIGTLIPTAGLFKAVYFTLLRPARIAQPVVRLDNPEPHLFVQGVGGAVLTLATIAFLAGAPAIGWALCWLVVALAALNLFAGICVGCLMYYQLHRLGVPGFTHAPVTELSAAQGR